MHERREEACGSASRRRSIHTQRNYQEPQTLEGREEIQQGGEGGGAYHAGDVGEAGGGLRRSVHLPNGEGQG